MKKIAGFALVICLVSASALSAQALPFTKRVVSQEEYATAIEKDDRTILNVSCNMIALASNTTFKHSFMGCDDLAAYIRRLTVLPCPQVETRLARVLPTGFIDLYGYRRELRQGEMCLYDNQSALWFASISCGNLITDVLPVFTAMREERAIADAVESEGARLAVDADRTSRQRDTSKVQNFWRRHRKWLIPAIAGVGVGVLLAQQDWLKTEVTNEQTVIVSR